MPRKKTKYVKDPDGKKKLLKESKSPKGRGVDLTDGQKKFLKESYTKLSKKKEFEKLTKDERTYINRIKAGKARAKGKNTLRVDGRYLSGKIVEAVKKVAKRKGITVKQALKQYKKDFTSLIERGQVINKEFVYTVIDALKGSKNKQVRINNDKDTTVTSFRAGKVQAINRLVRLNNRLLSDTRAVAVKVDIAFMLDNSIKVTAPDLPDPKVTGESLEFWAEQYEGIELIISY